MDPMLFPITSIIVFVVLLLIMLKPLARRTYMELLAFAFLLVLAGGILIFANHAEGSDSTGAFMGYNLLWIGLYTGAAALFKR
ncbi:hypothetical protein IDH44_17020 [Paenibacillus sp. IB182496]|uniref:Uncharacterized protein n=1 Tax=Paenibacillus sabuli TaxID=2772509 RepID=A0A927GT27_9BACL|nr:hypothetical protein [Paenibacillus sabuli]MBD2846901.1 hypothetical protein [Paenibacillus sabuli]